ncbi:phosphoglucomutase (alpha-D-glucose-1,6-bisphosphate-dependent) [Thermus sp. NEB1569]|uniref:phosphoglucomutase (alpha-D-glucose-1,6-bisphosphate-dependent) n=1 Tax=Thermus sp. NEB1569 TaxID=2918899 RepID=UPI001EFBB8CC|nr:phosphoglucomutase (alpha-D-glucose-1,6-bisphosphate-dependent) [Thermus sp. NEB1569]ULR40679.1 phosphoglucomutase (alpha-D-glucose-1,6-bisphosphate-dependent) [Thermus sp. NEB1569]
MDLLRLLTLYYEERPDPQNPLQRVAFGTSGHRGTSLKGTFTEAHVLAITQAIADLRASFGATGPLFLAKDTHALSEPAWATTLTVLAANGIEVRLEEGYTPTPLVSLAILEHNAHHPAKADGILLTPSHNPPEDGGLKYNPPTGGPADTRITKAIEERANTLLAEGLKGVKRLPFREALRQAKPFDYVGLYVEKIREAVDLEAIKVAGLRLGVDPLGGASLRVWERLAEAYHLNLEVVNPTVDPTFRFMPPDHDGKIRMDCSSPYAMAGLLALKDRFDLAIGNDPDADRHGIVTPRGLMNPNHYLAAAVFHLYTTRTWPGAKVGKTAVTSALLDRVAKALGREVYETPVGFKYFVDGLLQGWLGFGGEESAGASFLRFDGRPFSTDKDGILLGLLAAEILAKRGKAPDELYEELAANLGRPFYARKDLPVTPEAKARLARLSPEDVKEKELAGEPILAILTRAPGNGELLGGLKVVTENAWFAVRPSGTEDVAKVYAESFKGEEHLKGVLEAAMALVRKTLG